MEIAILLICSLVVNALLFTSNAIRCGKCIERSNHEEKLRFLAERKNIADECKRCKCCKYDDAIYCGLVDSKR